MHGLQEHVQKRKGDQSMKQKRKLTRMEKTLLEKAGFNPEEFYRIKRIGKTTEFYNDRTKEIVVLTKE